MYSCEGSIVKNPSHGITVCHHSASLVMPNGDPRDAWFFPTPTLTIHSYGLKKAHIDYPLSVYI